MRKTPIAAKAYFVLESTTAPSNRNRTQLTLSVTAACLEKVNKKRRNKTREVWWIVSKYVRFYLIWYWKTNDGLNEARWKSLARSKARTCCFEFVPTQWSWSWGSKAWSNLQMLWYVWTLCFVKRATNRRRVSKYMRVHVYVVYHISCVSVCVCVLSHLFWTPL